MLYIIVALATILTSALLKIEIMFSCEEVQPAVAWQAAVMTSLRLLVKYLFSIL